MRRKVVGHSFDLEVFEEVITDPETGTTEFDECGTYSANSIIHLL